MEDGKYKVQNINTMPAVILKMMMYNKITLPVVIKKHYKL
jgi:hypothetical protein